VEQGGGAIRADMSIDLAFQNHSLIYCFHPPSLLPPSLLPSLAGDSFMRRYYTTFNYEKETVGLAEAA